MISMEKKYRTFDGREVRLYAVDGGGKFPIHGAANTDGDWLAYSWSVGGHCDLLSLDSQRDDLVEVKTKHEGWVNLYPRGRFTDATLQITVGPGIFIREADARANSSADCIATILISWEA